MAYGVTPEGFVKERLADVKSRVQARLRTDLGNGLDLSDTSLLGQIIGIVCEEIALLWEALEDTYDSQFPDSATGVSLDKAISYNGLRRLPATKSSYDGQLLFGTAGAVVPAGTLFSVPNVAGAQFATASAVTLVAGADEVQQIAFSSVPASGSWKLTFNSQDTSALAFNANAAAVQAALRLLSGLSAVTVSGDYTSGFTVTFAGSAGKRDQPLLAVTTTSLQNSTPAAVTVVPSQTVQGVPQGVVTVRSTADETATGYVPPVAPAGSLTNIDTPVAGLSATTNPTDVTVGRTVESDIALRVRRQQQLQVAGAGTELAIKSRLLQIEGVTAAIVFQNKDDVTDGAGRPPHSFEAVVVGGLTQTILNTIWAVEPAGISTFGSVTGTVVDSNGQNQTVRFSRATSVPIYVSLDVTKDSTFPANGQALIQARLVEWGNALGLGTDIVVYPQLVAAIASIPGIVNVRVRVSKAAVSTTPGAAAVDSAIVIAANEVSTWDSTRTSVNVL